MSSDSAPKHWVTVPLKQIVRKLVDGSHTPPEKKSEGLPMLSAVNIVGNQVRFSTFRLIDPAAFAEEDRRTNIQAGDVLLTIVGAIGRAAVVSQGVPRFTLQRSVAVLSPIFVDPQFLMYQLEAPRLSRHLEVNARGTAQKGVYLGTLGEIEVWIPPLAEQRRIVAKIEELFSELDKGVESLTTAGGQLKAYRQSLLKHAFEGKLTEGWRASNSDQLEPPHAVLNRIREQRSKSAGRFSSRRKARRGLNAKQITEAFRVDPELTNLSPLPLGWTFVPFSLLAESIKNGISKKPSGTGSLKIFRISAVRPMEFDLTDWRITDDEPEYSEYRLHKGDLVFTRYNGSRGYVGVAAVYEGDESHVYPDKLIRCEIARDLVDPGYLVKAVNCGQSRRFVESRIRTTAGQAGISGGDLKAIPIPLCPLEEQILISSRLDTQFSEISRFELEIETGLRKASFMRQSILRRAFSGQLVPKDPNDEPASALLERIRSERAGSAIGRPPPRRPARGQDG